MLSFWNLHYTAYGPAQSASTSPSIVGTSSAFLAVANTQGYNQGGFYAVGRFWTWYSDGTNIVMASSVDGVIWTVALVAPWGMSGSTFSGVFDGKYFYYIAAHDKSMAYRRGVPNSDGTITWSAPEQTLDRTPCLPGDYGCDQTAIAVDSTGHVWVGFAQPYTDSPGAPGGWPWLTRNAATDGTWRTDTGYPVKLNPNKSPGAFTGEWGVIILPLTNGKVAILYSRNGLPFYGRLYDPAVGLGPETVVDSNPLSGNNRYSSAVAIGDTVYLAYISNEDGPLRFVAGSFGGSWSDIVLSPTTSTGWPDFTHSGWPEWTPAMTVDSAGDLYVLWAGLPSSMAGIPFCTAYLSNGDCGSGGWWNGNGEFSIYYMKYSGGSWGPRVEWLTDNNGFRTTENNPDRRNFFVFPAQYGKYIGVTYEDGGPPSWTIKFAILSQGISLTATPTSASPSSSIPTETTPPTMTSSTTNATSLSGNPRCPVALVAAGSFLEPYANSLRGFRDNQVLKTLPGRAFMSTFNAWYYSWAPSVARAAAGYLQFTEVLRVSLIPLFVILYASYYSFLAVAPIGSETAAIVAGIVAALLIGVVYLAPGVYLSQRILQRRRNLVRFGKVTMPVAAWVVGSLLLTQAAYVLGSFALMGVATANLAVSTLTLGCTLGVRAIATNQPSSINLGIISSIKRFKQEPIWVRLCKRPTIVELGVRGDLSSHVRE